MLCLDNYSNNIMIMLFVHVNRPLIRLSLLKHPYGSPLWNLEHSHMYVKALFWHNLERQSQVWPWICVWHNEDNTELVQFINIKVIRSIIPSIIIANITEMKGLPFNNSHSLQVVLTVNIASEVEWFIQVI